MGSSLDLSGAVIIALHGRPKGRPVRRTCVNEETIHKGTLLSFSGSTVNQVHASTGKQVFAGIANQEKVANDGSTTIGAWTAGIFDLTASPTGADIGVGERVILSGMNTIGALLAADAAAGVLGFGTALEADSASEVIQVELD